MAAVLLWPECVAVPLPALVDTACPRDGIFHGRGVLLGQTLQDGHSVVAVLMQSLLQVVARTDAGQPGRQDLQHGLDGHCVDSGDLWPRVRGVGKVAQELQGG